ncbi:MAG TPA: fused MFS/spermidine synthase [Flavobacteriaceae bacterium]|nr:fused MFS/spermidine synthase [Flavobacteriaceae bacterium]
MEKTSGDSKKDAKDLIIYYPSEVNGRLKVKWREGKKVLNTKQTNYSYGTLEKVLNYGLDSIPLENIESVLLLGMGGGCIINSLRNRYQCLAPITAIELDPVVIDIAEKEFGITESEDLNIIVGDAYDYTLETKSRFDLTIIDIFIDIYVPDKFYSTKFWEAIAKAVNLNGFVLFNTGIDLTEEQVNAFLDSLPDCFLYQVMFNVYESNTLIILNKFHED